MSGDTEPGVQTVIAAQAGDGQALDDLISQYLPLIYNIVGRALNGHADVDDVVQETMLRAVRGVAGLRDPAAFRSWLVAVAVRQLRDYCQARQAAPVPDLGQAGRDVPDPAADFVDLTILRLGLSGQRLQTAQATRWLDGDDRELLALWWLEAAGELGRDEIAAALGLPARHAAVRIARMKEQLTTSRVVVRALGADPGCDGLAAATSGWDRVPSPLWRKRLARHIRDCDACAAHHDGLIPAERLLGGLPLIPAAAAAGELLPRWGGQLSPGRHPWQPAGSPPHTGQSRGDLSHGRGAHASQAGTHGRRVLRRAVGTSRHVRMASKVAGSLQPKVLAVTLAATCAAGGALAVAHQHKARPASFTRPPATAAPVTAVLARPAPLRRVPRRPAVTAAANAKKGVSAWTFNGVGRALAESGASWYYTWSSGQAGIASPRGAAFVPMIWGPGSVTAAALSQVRHEGHILLGFNEPDLGSQSNMTVPQALALWPKLMATGMRLGSPAVATGAATPGGWLDRFMRGAATRHYRVNFITVHWYGADFATGPAVSQLKSYLQAIYARYHLPVWVTEFALARFGPSTVFPTQRQQAAFLTASTSMLERLRYVQRYAWFALPATPGDGSAGLFLPGPVATRVGRAFEAVDARR
jgi:RNA polymerase sigma factor (sigma-70 family)